MDRKYSRLLCRAIPNSSITCPPSPAIMRLRRVRFSNGATNLYWVRLYTAQYGMLTRPKSMLPFQIGLESELVLRGCFFFPVLDFRAAIGILTQQSEIATPVFCFSSCMLRLFGALP